MKNIFFACVFALLLSCSSKPDKLGQLDLQKWRSDRGGCEGKRATLVDAFKAEESQMMGKFSDDIGLVAKCFESSQPSLVNQVIS